MRRRMSWLLLAPAVAGPWGCATEDREQPAALPLTDGDSGPLDAEAAARGADAAEAPRESGAGGRADAIAPDADGPPWWLQRPPEFCLPPCLYDALVACGVPGAGVPPPDTATCRFDADQTVTCDEQAGYLVNGNYLSGLRYYKDGEACLQRGWWGSYEDWHLPGELAFARLPLNNALESIGVECDGKTYDIDLNDPRCENWRVPYFLPAERGEPAMCPPGVCPPEPPWP